ncbi:DUF475 domain-containing protein [bacterium]|nr:DUF475 domain-containing protein [bacterium]
MKNYFLGSYILTALGFPAAYFWAEHVAPGSGLQAIFIVFVLSILEISLSFDNAVVNAMKLENMSEKWQKRFLTWGIAIAVFGMRFLFPIIVVSVFAKINPVEVGKIAFTNSSLYAHYLHQTHAPIVTFGGAFLMMLFTHYFFNCEKTVHWICPVEKAMCKLDRFKGIEAIITGLLVLAVHFITFPHYGYSILKSGLIGILIYEAINFMVARLEKKAEANLEACANTVKCTGIVGFMYLELIDASFSLDSVLGAFALSKDIIIITIGLTIGAMFVRSLTILMLKKKTLAQFLYLEHGAHWAIGALALLMMVSAIKEVPEVVTGLIGFVFILLAFISSLIHNKKCKCE